jgi:N-acetylglutamate synthase-like GNAT family acetyltransferase
VPGHGALVVAWADKRAIGCGAVRLIDTGTAELKRMYIVPEHRKKGLAGAILRVFEDRARALGATRVVLETVTDPPAAVALYRAAGYDEIPKLGPYVDSEISFCHGQELLTSAVAVRRSDVVASEACPPGAGFIGPAVPLRVVRAVLGVSPKCRSVSPSRQRTGAIPIQGAEPLSPHNFMTIAL